jgi:uncharacterized metal-binding protein
MTDKKSSECTGGPRLIFACSGAADVGAVDGCPLNCAKSTLENAGFTSFRHLQLADLGMQKGSTPPTEDNIGKVLRKATEIFAA